MPKIVYLEPVRGASFRSRLRSDTLWGALCWNILALYGKAGLEKFIDSYGDNTGPLHLSSAFPWVETGGQRHHFLPNPLRRPPAMEPLAAGGATAQKQHLRRHKLQQKRAEWVSWEELDQRLGNRTEPDFPKVAPSFDTSPMTHNLVDRRRLGTLTVEGDGQLYHTLENTYKWQGKEYDAKSSRSGLYFFINGDHEYLEPVLRYMSVNGLGGDRTIGKGHFRVHLAEKDAHDLDGPTFPLPRVKNANARVSLSLYHPAETGEALRTLETSDEYLLQYKLEDRQGRSVEDSVQQLAGKLYFAEGSVFPKSTLTPDYPGHLVEMRKHRLGHTIYRYGYAFPLDLKIPHLDD